MPLYNNGNPFIGGSVMTIDLPDGKYVSRLTNGTGRFGEPRDKELLRFTNPRYTYKHVEEVVPPLPENPTIQQWLDDDRYDLGRSSLQTSSHGGRCCGIQNIYRFWTGDYGENENSSPTKANVKLLKQWCDERQQRVDRDAGGPSIYEICLTEDQLDQENEQGFAWREILEGYFGFEEKYNFRNANTHGRRVFVFIKDFQYVEYAGEEF